MSRPARTLTSTRNPEIRDVARLHRRRTREATGRYLVEGPNAVEEALRDGVVETVYATATMVAAYADADVTVVEVSDHALDRLADSRSPQGVVAVARRVVTPLDEVVGHGVLPVLVEPSDPGNLGTIIRTADAAGAAGVVVVGDAVDPWHPKVVRATAGSLTHLPLTTAEHLDAVLETCASAGQRIVALDMHGAGSVFDLERRAGPVALLFGSEAHGLPASVRNRVDETLSVPTYGRAESLNLAAAAAVALYAAARGERRQ